MKIIFGFECSGECRDAFTEMGHDVISCDLLASEKPGKHYQGDIFDILYAEKYDLGGFFPECTHLAVSGARWFKYKQAEQKAAIEMFLKITEAPIPKMFIENPIGIMSRIYRKPDQIIQPWMFGHGETKATCLWLKGLPKLQPTNIVPGREHRVHRMPPGPNRARDRARTYHGIAEAMASQWG
jgi:hypothetical protein